MSEHTHDAGHAAGHEHGDGTHHTNYVRTWKILLALLVVSVAGPFLGHPAITLVTAFGIAFVKAYLVIRDFMHLTVQPKVVVYFLATCLAFMMVFFAGVAPDVMEHEGANWENVAAKKATADALAAQAAGHGAHGAAHGEHGGGASH